jgi:outer membrane protein
LVVAFVIGGTFATSSAAVTLTEESVRSRALEANRDYLSAQQEVEKARSEITKARSGALPQLSIGGSYVRNIETPSFFFFAEDEVTEIKVGTDNSFSASVSLMQPIWHGGRVFTAYKIARRYRDYAEAVEAQVQNEVAAAAEQLFFDAILRQSTLETLTKALEAAEANLEVVKQKHTQGLVSDYELLRARVEAANLRPSIIEAESNIRISQKRLKSFLGLPLDEELVLVEAVDDTSLTLPPMTVLVDSALHNRPERHQTDLMTEITDKAVSVARSGYFPSFDAFTRYEWQAQSNEFTLSENSSSSWTAGLQMTYPIFQGGYTAGEVANYKAQNMQARLEAQQTRDDIKLEVQQAYDRLMQAKKALDVQGETIAQAEEGLRIANLRYESGVGTQLEVLSAQSALTQSRNALALARFSFRSARSELKRATTLDIDRYLR